MPAAVEAVAVRAVASQLGDDVFGHRRVLEDGPGA
jgi:hypothetical protein